MEELRSAAASSIASGRPSRRPHTSATARAFSSFSSKAGSAARARATKSATASLAASSSNEACPCRRRKRQGRNRVRVLAGQSKRGTASRKHQQPGGRARSRATSSTSGRSCSRLSRTRSSLFSRRNSPTASSSDALLSATSKVWAIAAASNRGSRTAARSTKTAPSRSSCPSSSAAASARRVLPVPPGPVRVTSRTSSRRSSAVIAATSSRRPRSGVGGAGSSTRARSGSSGAVREGSCRKIRRSRSWSWGSGRLRAPPRRPLVRADRLGCVLLASGAVEREHVLGPKPLLVRLLDDQAFELRKQFVVTPERELGVVEPFLCVEPAIRKTRRFCSATRFTAQISERRPVPQLECRPQIVSGIGRWELVSRRSTSCSNRSTSSSPGFSLSS